MIYLPGIECTCSNETSEEMTRCASLCVSNTRRADVVGMLRVAFEHERRELARQRAILACIGPGGSSGWHSPAVLSPPPVRP